MENKWWEYYAVRYFVGTVIGAVIVAFLNLEPGSPFEDRLTIIGESKEATFLGVGLVSALGFAFCYIASAPMLTLHAARAHLRMSNIKTSVWLFIFCLLLPIGAAIWVLWQFLPPVAALGSGLVIGFQGGLVLLALITEFSVIESFYRGLATVRAKAVPEKDKPTHPASEYVTSYRHLREHGNAFMIVVLEFVLAYALVRSPSPVCAIVVLVGWLLPATFAWLLGTVLESRLVSKPLP